MIERIPKTMRAVVYRGVNDLRIETLPVPGIRSEEVLVKVAACGVCPTDVKKIQHGTVPPPRVFGHETSGTIVRVGSGVRGFRIGDRVALHHHVPCLDCHVCRHRAYAQCTQYKRTGITAGFEPAGGGYAEYVRVMSFVLPGVVKIPRRNSFLEGAMLEPVNTVLKGIKRLDLLPGDVALVVGQGPIGLMFTRLLHLRGVKVIASDLLPSRLRLARAFGARWTLRGGERDFADRVRRLTSVAGVDAVVIAVPIDRVVREALELVRGGGKVLIFAHTLRGAGCEVDLSAVCMDEKDLIGSYSSDLGLQREAARLVFSRRFDVRTLITDTLPLQRTAEGIRRAASPASASLKIMISQTEDSFGG